MLIYLHYYKVYGSESYYGDEPFSSPSKNPIIMDNYPKEGNISKVYLGKIPIEIKKVFIADNVKGKRTISALMGESDNEPIENKIDNAISQNINHNIFKSINWLVTIEIIISLEVDEKFIINNRKYIWFDGVYSSNLLQQHKSNINEKINSMVALISPIIGEDFFQKSIKEGYFLTSNEENLSFYTFPEPQLSMSVSSSKSLSTLNIQNITENLNILQTLEEHNLKVLKNIQHWYLSTLNETDTWKVFLWSFWGLEVLSKYYAKIYYKDIFDKVEEFTNVNSFSPIVLHSLLPQRNQKNLHLKASFSIMTAILAKEDSINDIELFKKITKIRNKISHGDVVLENELPEFETKKLFYKYYKLAIEDFK